MQLQSVMNLEKFQRLLGFLLENKRDQDEIVILFYLIQKNGTKEVEQVLDHYNSINIILYINLQFKVILLIGKILTSYVVEIIFTK